MSFLQVYQKPKYKTVGVNFDGTNDYGLRGAGLTGAADGDQFTVVFSFDLTGGDAAVHNIIGVSAGGVAVQRSTDNKFYITLDDSTLTTITQVVSTSTFEASAGWKTLLFSKSGTTLHFYDGDADISSVVVNDAGNIDLTALNWAVGATTGGGDKLVGNLADVWMAASYINFSVEANRRLFVDPNGRPVNKGNDGSLPTGTAPLIFLRRGIGDAADSFLTNKGTGGGFTVTGALGASTNGNPTD